MVFVRGVLEGFGPGVNGPFLVVTDLGSTNGVVVHWSSGASVRLRSRESCAVLSDAIIVLGEGVEGACAGHRCVLCAGCGGFFEDGVPAFAESLT